jgi:hypothetical protein
MDSGTIAIARQVAMELCEIQPEPNPPKDVGSTTLVFPSYRPGTLNGPERARVSEAEARVVYCMALANRRLPFGVEVPTTQQYAFSGTTKMSARTDLVVYASRRDPQPRLVRDLAIEFKAHNPRAESIRKDLEKLLREQCDGLWFHVLKNVHSRTIPVLMGKFTQAIEDLRLPWQECMHTLNVCVVVLEKKFWLYRTLAPSHGSVPDLSFDYEVRGEKVVVRDAKAWNFEAF